MSSKIPVSGTIQRPSGIRPPSYSNIPRYPVAPAAAVGVQYPYNTSGLDLPPAAVRRPSPSRLPRFTQESKPVGPKLFIQPPKAIRPATGHQPVALRVPPSAAAGGPALPKPLPVPKFFKPKPRHVEDPLTEAQKELKLLDELRANYVHIVQPPIVSPSRRPLSPLKKKTPPRVSPSRRSPVPIAPTHMMNQPHRLEQTLPKTVSPRHVSPMRLVSPRHVSPMRLVSPRHVSPMRLVSPPKVVTPRIFPKVVTPRRSPRIIHVVESSADIGPITEVPSDTITVVVTEEIATDDEWESVTLGYGVEDPRGLSAASNLSLVEAEVMMSVMYATISCNIRTVEFFMYKDRTRHASLDVVPTPAERRPVLYSAREVALNVLSGSHRWMLERQSLAFRLSRELKSRREGTRTRDSPMFDSKYVPAVTKGEEQILRNRWYHLRRGIAHSRNVFCTYCREVIREEVSYCYSLIDEMDRRIQHSSSRGEPIDPTWRHLMKDWACYLRIVQIMAEYSIQSIELTCVYDMCDAFRLVCHRCSLGKFIGETAPGMAHVLYEHESRKDRSFAWAMDYMENDFVWDRTKYPVWSPKLLMPVMSKMTVEQAPQQLGIYYLARSRPVYVATYVFGKRWRRILLEIITQSKVANKMVMFHAHLGRLIIMIRRLEAALSEVNSNPLQLSDKKLENMAAKHLYEYWQASSHLQPNMFDEMNDVIYNLLRTEYMSVKEKINEIVKGFVMEYVDTLCSKHRDLPSLVEGESFKMYKQVLYIYADMVTELDRALKALNSNSLWLLEKPFRAPVYLKAVCANIIEKVKNLPQGGRPGKECLPQFIAHRLPMPSWARDLITIRLENEVARKKAIHLARVTEEVRLINLKKKAKFHVTVEKRLAFRPYDKEPDRPEDMAEDPTSWPPREPNIPTGPHFWPEYLLDKWIVAEVGDKRWETPEGRLQAKYEQEDIHEKDFREILAESWQEQVLQAGPMQEPASELVLVDDILSHTDFGEDAAMGASLIKTSEYLPEWKSYYNIMFPTHNL